MQENHLEQYGLKQKDTRDFLFEVSKQLENSGDKAQKTLARYLFHYTFGDSGGSMKIEDTLALLGTAVRDQEFLVRQQELIEKTPGVTYQTKLPEKAYEWGKQFLSQILREVRSIICNESKEYSKIRKEFANYPKAFGVAVSAAVLNVVGVGGPMALGISTLVLLALTHATKNAFCKMTDDEVLTAIEKKVENDRRREHQALKKAFGKAVK